MGKERRGIGRVGVVSTEWGREWGREEGDREEVGE